MHSLIQINSLISAATTRSLSWSLSHSHPREWLHISGFCPQLKLQDRDLVVATLCHAYTTNFSSVMKTSVFYFT